MVSAAAGPASASDRASVQPLRWSVVPSANRGVGGLGALACLSATDCFAAGARVGGNAFTSTLIESWNGARWAIVPSPNKGPASDFNGLGGISCPSASFCITVGSYANINAQGHTLAETGTPARKITGIARR